MRKIYPIDQRMKFEPNELPAPQERKLDIWQLFMREFDALKSSALLGISLKEYNGQLVDVTQYMKLRIVEVSEELREGVE
jgi:hypothetical protein